ncbi:MAG TPA: sugar ABC transporter substrate-binding protein [Solirubrobacteraceae bacterium]|nr:sugar ABC transporter substrate-binding protein [Solirubrobacteraceae bacterium]
MRFASMKALVGAVLMIAVFAVAACGGDNGSTTGTGSSTGSAGAGNQKIALLLPESKTARYEALDRPLFQAKLKELCSGCQILYSNADQDASKQQSQAEAAITNGAKVLVLDPVDSASAASIVARAKQSNIPVISYDRLILNADIDYYVSFDSVKVGKLQGESLLKAIGSPQGKSIVMINGAPTDNNAKLFKQGAHSVLDPSGVKIAKEYDTPDWSPDKAQTEMEQAITAVGKSNIDGVYAANDGTGGGAIAAMKGAGIDPSKVPVTGQDAELAAVQRILAGDQYMTVYKPIKPLAEAAAELAVAVAQGKQPPSGLVNTKQDNGQKDVPTVGLDVVAVTKDNVNDTIVKDGVYKTSEICAGQYASACKDAGIQ